MAMPPVIVQTTHRRALAAGDRTPIGGGFLAEAGGVRWSLTRNTPSMWHATPCEGYQGTARHGSLSDVLAQIGLETR